VIASLLLAWSHSRMNPCDDTPRTVLPQELADLVVAETFYGYHGRLDAPVDPPAYATIPRQRGHDD
jgi:hypothetical protein